MSDTFKPITGHKMKAYINAGTHAVPVWTELREIGDLNIVDLSRNLAELKRRGREFTKNLPAMIGTIAVEFTLHFGIGRTVYDMLREAFFDGTVYEFAFMNGNIATNGMQGLTNQMLVENFPWNQALEEVSGHDVRLCTGYMEDEVNGGELEPYWFIVGTTTTTTTT
jgi:hypothetical protein